ncbi:MAG: aKG-HExxH-type peptide beta-hydroxylase [Elusimicrobiota bacterium]
MRDPKTFLDRLGVKVSPDFSYTTALAAGESLNIKLDESLRLIAREWPEMSREASQAILGVVWAQSDGFESGCDPKQFGVIVLNKDVFQQASPWEIATALIHETSHHALYVETTLDPLIPDDFMTPLYSTIRRETRPAIGVLHAAYAIARRGIWGLRLKRNGSEPGAVDEVRRIGRQYIHHYGTLLTELEKIRFSPRGAHIYQELRGLEPDFRELT